jgi:hypothetical protein
MKVRYVRFEVLTIVVRKGFVLRDVTPCSPFESQPTWLCVTPAFMAHYSTLKIVAIYLFETSVDFQRILCRYIPEGRILQTSDISAFAYLLTYLLMYGAEPFLKSYQLCSHSGDSQQFQGTGRFVTVFTRAFH